MPSLKLNKEGQLSRYVIAVGVVLLAWLLREAGTPLWGPTALPFIFFFPAIVISAWYGRLRLALISIALSAFLAAYFFLQPRFTLAIEKSVDVLALISFVVVALCIALAIEYMHRANERAMRTADVQREADELSARLAAIVTSSTDGIISKTLEGVVTTWNDGATAMFGYTADEMIGRQIHTLIPIEFRAEEDLILARLRAGERIDHFETVRMHKDGKLVSVSLTISPVKNSDGKIIGASKIARDITQRKITEEALQQTLRQQKALYTFVDRLHRSESLDDVYSAAMDAIVTALNCDRGAILMNDEAGVMHFVNWHGLSDEYRRAVEGHSPWTADTLNPEPVSISNVDESDFDESLRTAIKQEGIRSLHFFPLVSGARLIGKFVAYYDRPHVCVREEIDLATSIARQLAFGVARKQTEAALRENEERLRLATQTGKVGIWDWDILSDSVSWTESLYPVHGVTREEFPGTVEAFVSLIHPADRERVSQALTQSLEQDGAYDLEFRAVKPNGEIVWLFTEATVFRKDGKPMRMLGATLDITERKLAEAEREALLAREQELRKEAEAANRLKDEFLATMSHELRNPLNVILGYSEILLRSDEIKGSASLKRMGETLRRNALAQSHLIRDLLDLSRLRSGKLTLNTETVSLMTAINNAVETVRADAVAKNLTFEINPATDAVFVEGDLLRLEQIVWNLLSNAVKFTPLGGKISVTLKEFGEQINLTVIDTGQGIEPGFLPHVFEMFRQADASTRRAQSGMGIGLALVRQLVELHGGTVSVDSAGPGLGTRVTVRLPRSEQARTTLTPIVDFSSTSLSHLGVLVLDDSEDTTEMIRALLEQNGARVITATSGVEALRIASERDFDVVLSDISMPGMDGFEFLRRLRALPGKRDLPVLALTGFGRPEDIQRAENEGFFYHLTKPFDVTMLAHVLQNMPPRSR